MVHCFSVFGQQWSLPKKNTYTELIECYQSNKTKWFTTYDALLNEHNEIKDVRNDNYNNYIQTQNKKKYTFKVVQ